VTPEQIKRKYAAMLNNEILAGDPIAWMQDGSEFIVMTAVTAYRGSRCYAKVALCEVKKGVIPKMISERARGMVFIWELHKGLRKNGCKWRTRRSYETTLAQVTERCAWLNAKVARLESPEHQAWLKSEVARFAALRARPRA
jgi:hypothetical protein